MQMVRVVKSIYGRPVQFISEKQLHRPFFARIYAMSFDYLYLCKGKFTAKFILMSGRAAETGCIMHNTKV